MYNTLKVNNIKKEFVYSFSKDNFYIFFGTVFPKKTCDEELYNSELMFNILFEIIKLFNLILIIWYLMKLYNFINKNT